MRKFKFVVILAVVSVLDDRHLYRLYSIDR